MGDLCSISKPSLLKHYGDYKEYIYENLTWPEEAKQKRIQGNVEVRFMVDQFGKLQNFQISTDQPLLKKAVADLFETMQEWYPAVSHNRPIAWSEEIIPFVLE
jgi:TonB family protein